MIVYKILCEVKWLHEFYLTLDKGETIFEKPVQADRLHFLFDRFVKDIPSVHEDLEFLAHPSNLNYSDYHLRIVPSYAGFKIAVRCRKQILGGGTVVYSPLIPLPDALTVRVMIREKNNIQRYSGETSAAPLKPLWYFSSNDLPFAKTFPFLTSPVSAFVPAQSYVQSEIALHAGVGKVFLNNGAVDPWLPIPDTHYINSNDNRLLPLSFVYTFSAFENITHATFTLKDSTSAVVIKTDLANIKPMGSVSVSFRTTDERVKTIKHDTVTADLFYSLEVTGSGGYSKTFSSLLFAHDELEAENYSGVLDLMIKPAAANFDLLDGTGNLFTRIVGGVVQPAPVFELWMKSKYAFWEYVNNQRKKFKITAATTDLLADNGGVLSTKNPIPMSYSPVMLQKPDTSFQLLPNPDPEKEVRRDGNKIFLDMQVPESNLFPVL